MKHESIRKYLRRWCKDEGLVFVEYGERGIGRTFVGVLDAAISSYPDYGDYLYDDCPSGAIPFIPDLAYHKYPCVAVLYDKRRPLSEKCKYKNYMREHGHYAALKQLYQWIKWFEKNNYHYKKWEEDWYVDTWNKNGELVKACIGKRWRGNMVPPSGLMGRPSI
jgi:hypothetical protein